jgi:UDP-2,4-diacetamido-2,4,6-trideoxy-beta-L-altropyranose hydrolase
LNVLAKVPTWLLIRAEASNSIGTGHVMRMLALAQAWMDLHRGENIRVTFAGQALPEALVKRINDDGMDVWKLNAKPGCADDAAELVTRFRADGKGPAWIAADGYYFSVEFQRVLRQSGLNVLVMDDNGEIGQYDCDLILNQNIMANRAMYASRNPDAEMLLGTHYSLLRREFRKADLSSGTHKGDIQNIIITLGGSDTSVMVAAIVDALNGIPSPLSIRCIMGSLAAGSTQVDAMASGSKHRVEVLTNVRDMTLQMKWAQLSINAAGSTTWELCAMGVPMILVVLADNQREIAVRLDQMGCARSAGDWGGSATTDRIVRCVKELIPDVDQRREMITRARGLVDGKGAERVVETMIARSYGTSGHVTPRG